MVSSALQTVTLFFRELQRPSTMFALMTFKKNFPKSSESNKGSLRLNPTDKNTLQRKCFSQQISVGMAAAFYQDSMLITQIWSSGDLWIYVLHLQKKSLKFGK